MTGVDPSSPATAPGGRDEVERLVRDALRRVVDPCSIAAGVPIDVIDMGIIKAVDVRDGAIAITLRPTSPFCFQLDMIAAQIVAKVQEAVPHKVSTEVDFAADWDPEMMSEQARARLRAVRPASQDPTRPH
ncbi:DUF59 domain-containing protein [Rhizorhabdus wittichii]|uniref:DUF59 domain-containing protein n=1 Tax=Rhizorhabdus wittichii TaxID=160791 RepID=A0A975CZR6_9SPHN|nr:iron-sulfur cluster assembly protein [Rhizorhabdus wittichii]QTH20282.1 DUF59 domain-containing protein [Rhizorhabdus wittichii]